jgi:chromosome segregation ATPase
MSISQLKTPRRVDDPLRAALAQALEDAAVARESVERQRAAIEKTRGSVRAAERAVTTAQEGVGKAREAHAQALADSASSDTAPPASGMRAARQAVEDAQDEVEAAKGALAQLKQELPLWEGAAREADIAVEAAISAVLAVQVQPVLDRANGLLRELIPLRKTLFALLNDLPSAAGDVSAFERGRKPLAEMRAAVANLYTAAYFVDTSPVDTWTSARAALRADPNAVLEF